jgi:hypothetical protein
VNVCLGCKVPRTNWGAGPFLASVTAGDLTLESRSDRKWAIIAAVMEWADIKKLTELALTASLRPR